MRVLRERGEHDVRELALAVLSFSDRDDASLVGGCNSEQSRSKELLNKSDLLPAVVVVSEDSLQKREPRLRFDVHLVRKSISVAGTILGRVWSERLLSVCIDHHEAVCERDSTA